MKLTDKILSKLLGDDHNFDYEQNDGPTYYMYIDPIGDFIKNHDVNKILDRMDIVDIENFLRAKKIQKLTKKK